MLRRERGTVAYARHEDGRHLMIRQFSDGAHFFYVYQPNRGVERMVERAGLCGMGMDGLHEAMMNGVAGEAGWQWLPVEYAQVREGPRGEA